MTPHGRGCGAVFKTVAHFGNVERYKGQKWVTAWVLPVADDAFVNALLHSMNTIFM